MDKKYLLSHIEDAYNMACNSKLFESILNEAIEYKDKLQSELDEKLTEEEERLIMSAYLEGFFETISLEDFIKENLK